MSWPEYLDWIRYRNKNGPILAAKRIEMSLAYVAMNFAQAMMKKKSGGSFELSDFMLWQEKEPEKYASTVEVLGYLKQIAAGAKKDGS